VTRTLYHHPLSPLSRKVRLVLHEKRLTFDECVVDPWARESRLIALNPSGEVPVLVNEDGTIVPEAATICEYIEELHPQVPLIGKTPAERAEARRLAAWFDHKFGREVGDYLVGEKLVKRVSGRAAPDSRLLRAGRENIHTHMHYIAWLTERRKWLAGDALTIADLSAAAQLSLIDYLGDVPWEEHPLAKEWYVRVKSRPSFRCLLREAVQGVPAAPAYADLDF
jgi:glutathione S-transferase